MKVKVKKKRKSVTIRIEVVPKLFKKVVDQAGLNFQLLGAYSEVGIPLPMEGYYADVLYLEFDSEFCYVEDPSKISLRKKKGKKNGWKIHCPDKNLARFIKRLPKTRRRRFIGNVLAQCKRKKLKVA